MKVRTSIGLAAIAAFLAMGMLSPAVAQTGKPIRIIIGFPAGAGLDTLARMLGDKLRASLGQPVIVENKAGAAGRLSAEFVKTQPPDGNTLYIAPSAIMAIFPHSYKNLRYDAFKDFVPVSQLAQFQLAFAVSSALPAKTLREYLELVKRDPKASSYGSTGAGTPAHFFVVMFARAAAVELVHVPYKGTANVVTDVLGGQLPVAILTVSDVSPLHRSGKVRAIAVSGAKRTETLLDVPTFKEQGYDIEGTFWYGAYAPAGTPRPVVERLSASLVQAVQAADVRAWLVKVGMEATGTTPEALGAIHRAEYQRWGPVIKASGFLADD